jgi:cytoskeletal protein CcmA (bactofilin family)
MFGKKGLKPGAIHTLIGEGALIEGNLRFDGGCHIDGVVHGNVRGGADGQACLSISERGRVLGNVEVPKVTLSGIVEGNVVVTEHAEFGPTARVTGDVYYNLIEIAAGAEINGKLIHQAHAARDSVQESGSRPSKAAVEPELEVAH